MTDIYKNGVFRPLGTARLPDIINANARIKSVAVPRPVPSQPTGLELTMGDEDGELTGQCEGQPRIVDYYEIQYTLTDPNLPNTTWQHTAEAPLKLSAIVFLAMTFSCFLSGVSGVMVPLTLKKLGFDPATASSIFLTTATDVASMGFFLGIATLWLG